MTLSVVVDASRSHFEELYNGASAIQDRYHFAHRSSVSSTTWTQNHLEEVARLEITTEPLGTLFTIQPNYNIRISTWRSKGIALYAELRPESYLVLCSLVALTQWRTLTLNPLLQPEDFNHETDIRCLFTSHKHAQNPALALEKLEICPGCRAFYHCLGVDEELRVLDGAIRYARSGSHERGGAL